MNKYNAQVNFRADMFVYKIGTTIMAVYSDGTRKNLLTNRVESNKTIAPYSAHLANEKGTIIFIKDDELYINTVDNITKSIGSYDGEEFLTFSGPHLLLASGAAEIRHINVMNGDDYIIDVNANSALVSGHNIYFTNGNEVRIYDTCEYEFTDEFTVPSCSCNSDILEHVHNNNIYTHCWTCGATGNIINGNYYKSSFHHFNDRPECTITYEGASRVINYTFPIPANWKFDIIRNYLIVWNGNIYSVININGLC